MDDKVKISELVTKKEFQTGIKKVYKRFETLEAVLRAEIRITAKEAKEEIREEFRAGNNRLYNLVDGFLKEIKQTREEQVLIPHQISNHEIRISKLEKKVNQVKTPAFA